MDTASSKSCAGEVLDTVPLIMQFIRVEMRRSRGPGISVPQFRALNYLSRTEGASLSSVADRVGLSLPAMSRLIDGLVDRDLVRREESTEDRRRITLQLTGLGKDLIRTARAGAQARLSEALATLPASQRGEIALAMQRLRPVFLPRARSTGVPEG